MRKLGPPSPGTSRRMTADEAIATGLSRGISIRNLDGKIDFFRFRRGDAGDGCKTIVSQFMNMDEFRHRLKEFWER